MDAKKNFIKLTVDNEENGTHQASECDLIYAVAHDGNTGKFNITCSGKIDPNGLLNILSIATGTILEMLVNRYGIDVAEAQSHMEQTFNQTVANTLNTAKAAKEPETMEEIIRSCLNDLYN